MCAVWNGPFGWRRSNIIGNRSKNAESDLFILGLIEIQYSAPQYLEAVVRDGESKEKP